MTLARRRLLHQRAGGRRSRSRSDGSEAHPVRARRRSRDANSCINELFMLLYVVDYVERTTMRKLTISIADNVYDGLHARFGRGKIGRFLEDLARPYVVEDDLGASYAEMTGDRDREKDAAEWVDEMTHDMANAAW